MSDNKQEDSFRVIDRRPFTSEGELRQEVVEEEKREADRAAAIEAALKKNAPAPVASKSDEVDESEASTRSAGRRAEAYTGVRELWCAC